MQTDQKRSGNRPCTGSLVSERALVHRINRVLVWEAQRLIKSRGARQKQEHGDWYIINLSSCDEHSCYTVLSDFIDIEGLGLMYGCLTYSDTYRPRAPKSPPNPHAIA
jgi:hypothetical protein